MRISLDTTFARRAPHSGTAVYLERLQDAFSQIEGIELVQAVNRHRGRPAGGGFRSVRNLTDDLWWTGVELPRLARHAGADLIHHPLPAWSAVARVPQVVTVIDLAFERLPDHFDRRFRTYAHYYHRAAARAADAVICVSETTASDARELWGITPEKIVVAPLGAGQQLKLSQPGRPARPTYFLYVGDDEPRKNLGVLLAAYRIYRDQVERPLDLILAGSAYAEMPGVRVERRPGARRLGELYLGAAALVHPSLYEGFGLTPVEAMGLGTPVLAARSPGILEICADAVRYADPRDPVSFAGGMAELASDSSLRHELRARGKRRAAEFSWETCARRHLDAYSLALGA
jgi:glycosyltransferase involved in cell wall biosynthesis